MSGRLSYSTTFVDAVAKLDLEWANMPWSEEKELRVIILNA
jgi:hypothetical protein